jgi:glutamyl-tRNA synthetase
MWPIRTALSGVPVTPGGATALAEILGKPETFKRIQAGIDKLKKALG